MRYVSVGRRFWATLIDAILIGLVASPFAQTHASTTNGAQVSYSLTGTPALLTMLGWIAYYTLMEGALGATVGKFVVGIRVVAPDGSKAGLMPAFVRTLGRYVDAIPFFIPYLLGAIFIWKSPTRQRLGDRWAKTVVIRAGSNTGGSTAPGDHLASTPATPAVPPMPPMPPADA
ncbi:MAG: RDD family protein [Actinomycetota bacterium]